MGTWTHPNGFWPVWLYEWLSERKKLDNVRIATFGYDADYRNVLGPRNLLGIQDFARQLLDGVDLLYDNHGNV